MTYQITLSAEQKKRLCIALTHLETTNHGCFDDEASLLLGMLRNAEPTTDDAEVVNDFTT